MSRYKTFFIIMVFLMTLILFLFIIEGAFMVKKYLEPWNSGYYTKYTDPRTQIIAHGILAASGHNMQSWKFVCDAKDFTSFDMYLESNRLVKEVDPNLSQAIISQGTMYEYMVIAAQKLGYTLKTDMFPDGEIPMNTSSDVINKQRIAQISLEPEQKNESPMYVQIFKPDTSRTKYLKSKLNDFELTKLKEINTLNDVRIVYVNTGENYDKLKNYVIKAAEIESEVPRLMAESSSLFRKNEKEKNKYGYGFSFEGSGMQGLKMHVFQTLLTLFPSMNSTEASKQNFMTQTKLAAENNGGFILIISKNNDRISQFNSGVLYSKLQLTAASLGFAVQPLSQAIEEYPEMRDMRTNIHKDFVNPGETIQMIFRIGIPINKVPFSMRMNVESFIEDVL